MTQTVVDPSDPAFDHPSKPVGAFLDEATARRYEHEFGWTVAEDAGHGWRRTVASPRPLEIVELEIIRTLAASGAIVVAGGGGGIPVMRAGDGAIVGVEAVIDKDLASALLAARLGADLLAIPTGVERVAIDFGEPDQQWLDRLTIAEATQLAEDGQFGEGSMRPKVEALVGFVRQRPGGAGVITSPERLGDAWPGEPEPGSRSDVDRRRTDDAATVELAVNGTLMRGYESNRNLTDFGCEFVRDAQTAPVYRCGRSPAAIPA